MTKHKPSEERIEEILNAAESEILEYGYAGLTMDAIVARTTLSKGSVYRFFRNKRDIALALLKRMLERAASVDVEEALSWNLPIEDTLLKLLIPEFPLIGQQLRDWRIWLQLLPNMITDQDFVTVRQNNRQIGLANYRRLLEHLFRRDGLPIGEHLDKLEKYAVVGTMFLEGLAIFLLAGEPTDHVRDQIIEHASDFIRMQLKKVSHEFN